MKVCMISTHPISLGGVSSYTERLVQSLKDHEVDVVVFSNEPENKFQKQRDKGVYVTWNKGILYPFQIFKSLAAAVDIDIVHVQHEFFLYGGVFSAVFFPILLALVRLLGRPLVVTIHGVIPLSELNERFKEENNLKGSLILLKFGMVLLVRSIVSLSDAVIVHEAFLAESLEKDYKSPQRKIHVIPHGVEQMENRIPQDEAKDKLGLNNKAVILFFGYITKYKGIETLIDSFQYVAKKSGDYILIIGGGEHPRHRNSSQYDEYLIELRQRAFSVASEQRILFTGYIPNAKLPLYLSAADVLVFPYTTSMSSSGPLSLAMSYGKAVIASDIPPFSEIVPLEDALFSKDSCRALAEKLERMLNSSVLRNRVSSYLEIKARENSWQQVGSKTCEFYQKLLHPQN